MKLFRRSILFFLCFTLSLSLFSTLLPIRSIKSAPQKIKILPILLEFSDEPHQRTTSEIYDFFFSNKPEDRSLQNYYLEVANETVQFIPGSYGVGNWVKMPKTKLAYAKGDSVEALARDAFEILTNQNLDFKEYDQNHDGYIDYTIFVQSGDPSEGYSGSDVFWLHYWPYLLGAYVSEGLKVGNYNMTAEKFRGSKISPLQGICHEFYHYQGGWDLYSYLGNRDYAVSNWDIMAEDFNNFAMCGFSRMALGWLKPIMITKPGVYEIDALAGKGSKRLYQINLPGTQEYFFIENRQLVGIDSWWQGIPCTGLLFTHVDGSIKPGFRFNDGPTDFPHYAVWVEDGGGVLEKKDAVFCADKNRTQFMMDTNPNTLDYGKKSKIGIEFTDISLSGMKMTFRVAFKYQEPHPAVDIDIIDFGKIQKGINKTISIQIRNDGTGTLSGKLSSKDNWITFESNEFTGNDVTVKIIASADFIKNGKYKGKIDIKCKSGTVSISTKVEVVDKLGDINEDGFINKEDVKIFILSFGTKKGETIFNPDCDFDSNDQIDIVDMVILAKNVS